MSPCERLYMGWFNKLLKSRVSLSREQQAKGTGVASLSFASSFCFSSSPPPENAPSKPQSAPSSQLRWRRKYDLLLCHSHADSDIKEAKRLVSFLEASPHSLRCFLWQRDVCLGGAVFTEFCQAVQESHLQALLITPDFLQEDWCKYMMHQALAEGPMSSRLIPLIQNLSHSQYPRELRFYFYVDLSSNADQGYSLIYKTVLKYLEDLVKNEEASQRVRAMEGVGKAAHEEKSPSPPTAAIPREAAQKREERFNDAYQDNPQR